MYVRIFVIGVGFSSPQNLRNFGPRSYPHIMYVCEDICDRGRIPFSSKLQKKGVLKRES